MVSTITDKSEQARTLQQSFLAEMSETLYPVAQRGSEIEKHSFEVCYDPENERIHWKDLKDKINAPERMNGTFNASSSSELGRSRIAEKIKDHFAAEMEQDGAKIEFIGTGKKGAKPPEKDPYHIAYNWLWQHKFRHWLWENLVGTARDGVGQLMLEEVHSQTGEPKVIRDFDQDGLDEAVKVTKGKPYQLRVKPKQSGHLLLISKGTSNTLYCFCPSKALAVSDLVKADQAICLPQEGSGYKLKKKPLSYKEVGEEGLLAIVTPQPLMKDAFSATSPSVIKLDAAAMVKLSEQLASDLACELVYLEFKVTE